MRATPPMAAVRRSILSTRRVDDGAVESAISWSWSAALPTTPAERPPRPKHVKQSATIGCVSTIPVRIPRELFDAAAAAAEKANRSAAAQLVHWAEVGQTVDERHSRKLADTIDEQIADAIQRTDIGAALLDRGQPIAVLGPDGPIVRKDPNGTTTRLGDPDDQSVT